MAQKIFTITDFQKNGVMPDARTGSPAISHFNTRYGTTLKHSNDFAVDTHPTRTITDIKIQKYFDYAGTIYGLGLSATASTPQVLVWDSGDYDWGGSVSITFDSTGTTAPVLIGYSGYLYGLWRGTSMWSGQVSTGTFTATFKSISYTNVAQPIIHPLDGKVYWFYDNKVAVQSGTTGGDVTTDYLTSGGGSGLPSTFVITSAVPYNEFVAIAGYDSVTNHSSVVLWDRDSIIDNSPVYNFGEEKIKHIDVVEGVLIGVATEENSVNLVGDNPHLVIKAMSGNNFVTLRDYEFSSVKIGGKSHYNDKLYFVFDTSDNASGHMLVASVDKYGRVVYEFELHDAGITNTGIPTGLLVDKSNAFVGHDDSGASYHTTNQTTDVATYVTQIIESDTLVEDLSLVGAVVRNEAIPTSGSVSVYSRSGANTEADWYDTSSWTLLRTFNTAGDTKGSFTKSGSATMPSDSTRFQFKLESVKTDITGFQATFDTKKSNSHG